MNAFSRTPWWRLSAALALAVAAGAGLALERPLDGDTFKSLRRQVGERADAEAKACKRLKDNARDVCLAEAKARAAVARAELDARREPGAEAELDVKRARAEGDRLVARARCDASKGTARDRCRQTADDRRDAAIRLAKVEKVQRQAELKAAASGEPKPGSQQSPEARFASAKAYCAMQGLERDRCLEDAKRRFNKS